MPAHAKQPTLAPEPWWAKWVLALLKLLLAFALAVLTLLFTRARHNSRLTDPPATQRRAAREPGPICSNARAAGTLRSFPRSHTIFGTYTSQRRRG